MNPLQHKLVRCLGTDSQINTTLPLLPMSESQSKGPAAPSQLQADAVQALLGGSSKKLRPQQRLASSFGEQAELADESSTNKYSLLCPKEGCGSLILKLGIAVLTPNKQAPASIPRLLALMSFSKMATDLHGQFPFVIYSSIHRVILHLPLYPLMIQTMPLHGG